MYFNEKDFNGVGNNTLFYEVSLKMEIERLERELATSSNSAQEKASIYIKIEQLKAKLDECENQKFGGKCK